MSDAAPNSRSAQESASEPSVESVARQTAAVSVDASRSQTMAVANMRNACACSTTDPHPVQETARTGGGGLGFPASRDPCAQRSRSGPRAGRQSRSNVRCGASPRVDRWSLRQRATSRRARCAGCQRPPARGRGRDLGGVRAARGAPGRPAAAAGRGSCRDRHATARGPARACSSSAPTAQAHHAESGRRQRPRSGRRDRAAGHHVLVRTPSGRVARRPRQSFAKKSSVARSSATTVRRPRRRRSHRSTTGQAEARG